MTVAVLVELKHLPKNSGLIIQEIYVEKSVPRTLQASLYPDVDISIEIYNVNKTSTSRNGTFDINLYTLVATTS